jgi:glutaminyl-tRNA synthetase
MYDFAHSLSDSIEGITHSICTLEFEDHRPLYDWFQETLHVERRSRQIEFARLNLNYTVMSKRKLLSMVQRGLVTGWDDPRMPTICGLRRRGYTAQAIRSFCERIGVAKRDGIVDVALLEHSLREDLNEKAPRVMGVLHPLKLVLDNYPADQVEEIAAVNNPENPSAGTRKVAFSRDLFIEREDFMEDPPKKFFRLAPGRTVRLRYAYLVTCESVIKDENGEITEIHCRYIPESTDGDTSSTPKAKATLHWVSARHSIPAEIRLYDRLFSVENPGDEKEGKDFTEYLNPNSLEVLQSCRVEAGLSAAKPGECFQFERMGYFCMDPDSKPELPVFNRTVTLRDAWAKIVKSGAK